MLRNGTALEHPGSNFMSINPLVTESFGTVVSKWVVSRAIGKLDSHPYLKHSQTAYLASEALAAGSGKRPANYRPEDDCPVPVRAPEGLGCYPAHRLRGGSVRKVHDRDERDREGL